MTIEQTIEVPVDRRVFFEFLAPKEIPVGPARVELKVTPVPERQDESSRDKNKPTPRADRFLGIAKELGEITLEQIKDERLARQLK